jgi:hypothetical protein
MPALECSRAVGGRRSIEEKDMRIVKTVVVAALLGLPLASQAHEGHKHSVNNRQYNQYHRIAQGIDSGELTRREARGLFHEQRTLKAQERRYRSNGYLNRWERAELHRELKDSSRHIYFQKHDRAERW